MPIDQPMLALVIARSAGTHDGKAGRPSIEWRVLILYGAITDIEQSEYWEAYHKAFRPNPQQADLPLETQESTASKQWLPKELLAAIRKERKERTDPRQGG